MDTMRSMPLSEAPIGRRMRIRTLRSTPDISARLRDMGLFENAVIRCVARGHAALICEVSDTRVGLNERVADTIHVAACQ
jgi:Fe2+ transport system protein FeoA